MPRVHRNARYAAILREVNEMSELIRDLLRERVILEQELSRLHMLQGTFPRIRALDLERLDLREQAEAIRRAVSRLIRSVPRNRRRYSF